MTRRLQMEISKLNEKLLGLGIMVESRVKQSIVALITRDLILAKSIINSDNDVDLTEVEIEEDCLKIMALYQPVAEDLRFLVATIKINNDLERVGDEAVNIAQRSMIILKYPPLDLNLDIKNMADNVQEMLRLSLDSLVYRDIDIAYKVRLLDDNIDVMNRANYDMIKQSLNRCSERAGLLLNMLLVSRHLERIADHATNIAEEVIHILEGEIPRHKGL